MGILLGREPRRRSWLARVFQAPEGEPTHAQLEHISSLSQGARLWFERGIVRCKEAAYTASDGVHNAVPRR